MIGWLIPNKPHVASFRYRCAIPMKALWAMEVENDFGEGDVTVIAKDWVSLEEVRELKGPVIWDVCDDHFNDKQGFYYRAVAEIAHTITVPTEGMRQRVLASTGREAFVVADPYEFPEVKATMKSGWAKNLFWYGHKSNLLGLMENREAFEGRELQIVSNYQGCHPWSWENMLKGFDWCDVVPIPVLQDEKNQAKSPNRMVEAIRQGRYVVANPLPAYEGYGMWQGDLKEGLQWVDDNPDYALEAVRKAQQIVEEKHAPNIIAAQWLKVFEHVTG